jgi:hypothetical protein
MAGTVAPVPWKVKGSWVREGELTATLNIGKNKSIVLSGNKGDLIVR